MSALILSDCNDRGVGTITLNRPELRNAFNDEVIAQLHSALEAMAENPRVRVVVLAGNGPAFSAGGDLNWMRRMADYTDADNQRDVGKLAALLQRLYTLPQPTLARVHGDAFAGGIGLLSACDLAVCAAEATFSLSEVKLGLIPATISPYVIRAIGPRAAHRYFLTAERFHAAEAARIGLVHEVVAAEALDARVGALVDALLSASPNALRACKKLLHDVAEREINTALIAETVAGIAQIRASDEGKEGVQAFLQKRKPAWLA